ncbi:hypothetical protein Pedsa_1801 [Pseudopedobacter saltans DSM 12145]|uniref:Secretion system C-terminal sorting domain-containing protein n=1 Tax=Pseudopedobacter saltans (strain ATCC 51119 / DSM 12145 / JCM 21818 / CCUG 39354 / LMG 10337 / NBRC 100064 / NCIMB 13643) TaxID=762903 RepID=F0S894_PSESL|nr:T9SS type A sorting domain-containing protein [Pseudopedobacter saltans]ADY52356.1 hypothetical protein Pedsa_1801 [Pseudopedobacter saltans DSM 12145]
MKKLFTLLLAICCFSQLKAQISGDYRSVKSGNWNDIGVWEIYSTSWKAATTKPGSSRNVTVTAGHTVTLDGSNSCNNLTVEAGATLNSSVNAAEEAYFLRVGGVSGSNAIVQNNGLIGSTNGTGDGIMLEAAANAASVIIRGSGICQVERLRAVSGNNNNFVMEIDQDITVTAENAAAFTAYYNNSANKSTDNYTITINEGKTVRILNNSGYFHFASNSTSYPGGNYTYNINGILDISNSTVTSHIIPVSNSASDKNVILNINGLLKLGTGLNLINSSPSGNNDGKVVINVNNGGLIDATKTTTLTTGDNYFRLAGNGSLKRKVDNNDVLFPIGLQSGSSANSVILNNSGTETNFTVNLVSTFDVNPASTQIVNRQWNITTEDAGANTNIKLNWKAADQGSGFDLLQGVSLARLDGSSWTPVATSLTTGPDASGFYQAEHSGITSFGSFSLQNTSTLPLDFVNFSLALKKNTVFSSVALNWITANEINTKDFLIERGTDRNNFITVGTISSKNNAGLNYYSFNDNSPSYGTNYYRLKQIDNDGKFSFSKILSINIDNKIDIVTYPNPSSKDLHISYPAKAFNHTVITISDMTGKIIRKIDNYDVNDSSQFLYNIEDLKPQIYLLTVSNAVIFKSIKFVKN